MSILKKHAGNPLGDLRAEHDHAMLDVAFYETPDYKSLVETGDKTVVVGRRGTGKSALAYYLGKFWHGVPKTRVIELTLEEDQVIGLGPLLKKFGTNYRLITAGCKLVWRYCLAMEIALELSPHFKFAKSDDNGVLANHLKTWRSFGNSATTRLRRLMQTMVASTQEPEQLIADLAEKLSLSQIDRALDECLQNLGFQAVIFIDRLDEGYELTDVSVGFVDGIVSATVEFNAKHKQVRALLFLRDNMFRTIAKRNPDYSRNIEGQVLRLHWSEYDLMNMVCERLRFAFDIPKEETNKVWNRCVSKELKGREGFKKCLQLTLYRPRDILLLLNEAFYVAGKGNREQVIPEDLRDAGKTISVSRLDDLQKEYSAIIPGIEHLTKAFANRKPEFAVHDAEECLRDILASSDYRTQVLQEFAVLAEPIDVLRALYGVGFVGIRDAQSNNFIFCHDGNSPDREIRPGDTLLVHPCYWMALNLTRDILSASQAEDIHDEYDIAVTETTPAQRDKKLNELISRLGMIPTGESGTKDFADWCHKVVATVFASSLRNVELVHGDETTGPGMLAAANLARTEAWSKLAEMLDVEQAVFFFYNEQGLDESEYRYAAGRIAAERGKMVFLITRDDVLEMTKEGELAWIRDICQKSGVVVIRLTAKYLATLLGKLRNPQKHDAIEKSFGGFINTYLNIHMRGLTKVLAASVGGQSETVSIAVPAAECYGELDIDEERRFVLKIFLKKTGAGKRTELCKPVPLKNQAYNILESGVSIARRHYIEDRFEQAREDGTPMSRPECEPPPEMSFEVEWTQDQLATVLHDKDNFADLTKAQKESMKTAMHRVRSLVKFTHDNCGLVSEPAENGARRSFIPLRLRKSG